MLHIYNTLGRRKEPFQERLPGEVSLYVCGVTVYDRCHIGHARVMVVFDMLVRVLRGLGYRVFYVRNITDIDDKILARAAENGEPYTALTARYIAALEEDERALGLLPPDAAPRATEHISQVTAMVQRLLERGHAYRAENGDVYYDISSFPAYGRLSGRNPDELLAGARVEPEEAKKDPRDFTLWKAAAAGEPGWDAPWGRGRPGWHIECSAMACHCLGPRLDIHGGGPDLVFPHHENEIAQSEAASGEQFASVWMHVGAVRMGEEKMSKSLANFITVRDVLLQCNAEVLRYFLLASHYRSPLDYSGERLREARAALVRLYGALARAPESAPTALQREEPWTARYLGALEDDFNLPVALSVLFELAHALNSCQQAAKAARLAGILKGLGSLLGLLQQSPVAFLQGGSGAEDVTVDRAIKRREKLRQQGDYEAADRIRQELAAQGIQLEDGSKGTVWRRS